MERPTDGAPHEEPKVYARPIPTLGQFARDYGVFRAVEANTLHQLRVVADLYERWAGGPVRVDELDDRSVALWLRELATTRAPATVRSKRSQILVLWRAAAEEGLCDGPSRRIRVAPVPYRNPTAWTVAEVEAIQAAAATVKGTHACGMPRAAWWVLAIRLAWATGLRWGDLVKLEVAAVQGDGRVAVLQHKTRRLVIRQIDDETVRMLQQSIAECPRALAVPWPSSGETFRQQFRRLVKLAKVRPGTWKWIRRAGITDAEARRPGAGAEHAGHAPGSPITARHYLDRTLLGLDAAGPSALRSPTGG
jgi:integrase